jgi:hypothetical protein
MKELLNGSKITLFRVGPVPVFPTLIVNVKLSSTLACEGVTATVMDALGVNVPVEVGEGVNVCVTNGPAVALVMGVFVSVGPKCEFDNITGRY